MGNKIFEALYEDIERINNLSFRVPESSRERVFNLLFENLMGNTDENIYEQQILQRAAEVNMPIEKYVNLARSRSNIERSLLFVSYLETIKITEISYEHILACYSLCNLEISSLKQNLRDLINPKKYGYLNYENNCYTTTAAGRNICEKKIFLREYTG